MHRSLGFIYILLPACIFFTSCAKYVTQTGKGSYYADKFEGRQTASGAIFSQHKFTAAHKTLAFGTKVIVRNLSNGKKVKVTINDRGPFVQGRIIDLSESAAKKLGMISQGIADVQLKYKTKKKSG